jgi:predicted phage terminase large subunit-like protein
MLKPKRLQKIDLPQLPPPEVNADPLPKKGIRDLRGQRFGRLFVYAYSRERQMANAKYEIYWKCQCDCGNDCEVTRRGLVVRNTKSCGCLNPGGREATVNSQKTHEKRSEMIKRVKVGLPPVPPTVVEGDPAVAFAQDSLLSYACLQWAGYQPAAHHRLIAHYLERVERGEIKRLIVQMPPRSGKSILISEYFPAWYLGKNPDKKIITASYGQELAEDFGRKVRNQIADPLYQEIFPGVKLSDDSAAANKFNLASPKMGGYYAVGVGGAIVGKGGHIILLDDLVKNRESADSESERRRVKDWYASAAYTRLMDNGPIVLVMQRWHTDDLAGWLIREHAHENWVVLNLPAINEKGEALWPEKFPIEILERIKRTLPKRDWEALYQQRPYAEEGGILKRQWWKIWPEGKPLPECSYIIQSWDTAFSDKEVKSNSYSARTTWGVFQRTDDDYANLILLEAWRGHVDYHDLRKEADKAYKEYQPDKVIIEKKASGQSLIQDLRRSGLPIVPWTPEKDKVTRAYAAQSLLENGRVYYPNRKWAEDMIEECCQFPQGSHNDFVDTLTQAFLWVQRSWLVRNSADVENDDEEDDDLPDNVTRLRPAKKKAAYG